VSTYALTIRQHHSPQRPWPFRMSRRLPIVPNSHIVSYLAVRIDALWLIGGSSR